jgi:23S rRNA pseudouridine1911/1915/1917 synthase
MTIVDKFAGKKSLTLFRLIHSAGNLSVLEILPMTGRIHQIRAHSAAIGFPVVCDPLYGNEKPVFLSSFKRGWRGDPLDEKPLLARLGLHALEVRVDSLCLSAPLARDMASLIRQLEKI